MTQSLGFDKSSFDGRVDWNAAKARRIAFATIRASDGLNADPLHLEEAAAALAAGVHVSPYHYYEPGQGVAAQGAKFLASTKGGDLPPMLDLEDYASTHGYAGIWGKEIKPWLDFVQGAVGIRPWIYSSPDYIRNYLSGETAVSEEKIIVANYDVNAPSFPKPLTPLSLIGWQFGDGRDAAFYGFQQANGCALYVVNDLDQYVAPWQSTSAVMPPPVTPGPTPVYSKGVTKVNVKIRSGAGTTYGLVFPWMVLAGRTVAVLDILLDGSGNTWIEIAQGQWCAATYQGQTFIELEP
jgi:hypothetical protein